MRISIVIPTLNEEDWLSATLTSITSQPEPWEIIVSDAGSTDRTRQIAAPLATVISAATGRAQQMNAGARLASGKALLFLHADTCLAPNALNAIRHALNRPSVEAGTFQLRFDCRGFWPSLYALCATVRWRSFTFGDRGLFMLRRTFEAIGGFPDVPILEDLLIVRRLHERGRFVYLPTPAFTAWRRFAEHGPIRQQLKNLHVLMQFVLGRPPERIKHHYPVSRRMSQKP